MSSFLFRTLHPEIYHGFDQQPPFFEGWYFKQISADQEKRVAVIPGVFLGKNEHAFIQVLEGHTRRSAYHRFPIGEFSARQDRFEVRIGQNLFRPEGILLNLEREGELGSLHGELINSGTKPWPVSLFSPGIMGPFAWTPRMECYHGVLSFDHEVNGQLTLDGEKVDFSGGRGYMEKDWGAAFPAAYIWFQSNHFKQPRTCLTASVAIIPWMKSAFRGAIIGLWLDGELHRFATYTGAKTEKLEITDEAVHWVTRGSGKRLELTARKAEAGLLYGPTRRDMGQRVDETLDAVIDVRLTDRGGKVLFQGTGRHAGLEINGDLERLLQM